MSIYNVYNYLLQFNSTTFYFHTSIGSDLFRKNEPAAEPHTICIEFENGAIYGFKYWKDAYTNWLKVNKDRDITYDYWFSNGYSFDGKYYLNTKNYESITYKKYFIGKLECNPETAKQIQTNNVSPSLSSREGKKFKTINPKSKS